MPKTSTMRAEPSQAEAEAQLAQFIAKFTPPLQALIRDVRAALRRRFPTAIELAYDNYNFFIIGYGPTEHPSDAIVSIAAAAKGVSLCFIQGARLPDPQGLLMGGGKQTRFVRLPSAAVLDQPAVEALLAAAVADAEETLPTSEPGRLVIRSVSAKQRPRQQKTGA